MIIFQQFPCKTSYTSLIIDDSHYLCLDLIEYSLKFWTKYEKEDSQNTMRCLFDKMQVEIQK